MSLKLFLLEPEIVFQARVNMPSGVTFPLDELTFDTVSLGTYSVVGIGMMVVFGSSAGADDLGRSRIRKPATSTTLYIGRSPQGIYDGEVNFVDNSYITVYRFYPVMSKIPYIDADQLAQSDAGIYQDSDLDFANYGVTNPPVANTGPAYASTIDSGTGKITVTFDSSNSFVTEPGASIASQTWNVYAGTITVGTSASVAITATFDAGFYYVSLLVADDNAELHYAYVPVLAIDPADDPCIYNFEITRHTIRPDGQEMSFRILEDIDAATYPAGTLVMLIDGDAGDDEDRSNVLFCGYLHENDDDIDATATGLLRGTEIHCVDAMGRLKALPGFPQLLEEQASPAKWGEMTGCNMDRFIHFLLQWQSTVLDVVDFTWSGTTTTYPFLRKEGQGTTIYEQVSRLCEALVPSYVFTCNRLGQLQVLVDPLTQDSGDRTASSQATLTSAYYSRLRYSQQRPRYHWLRSNGIVASAASVTSVFAVAPGPSPGQGPYALDDGEHLVINQAGLNAYCGHKYARLNAPQGSVAIELAEGNDYGLDPAAMTWLTLTIDAAVAAQRGLTFTEARFLMKQIDIRYNSGPTGLTKVVTIQAEREVVGLPATTVTVEAADPVDDGGWTPSTESSGDMFNSGLVPGVQQVGIIDAQGYIWTCNDFDQGSPTWSRNTAAAAAAGIGAGDLISFVVDPFSPGYRGTGSSINGWVVHKTKIYKLSDIFGTPAYTQVHTFTNQVNRINGEWASINCSFGRFQATESNNPWIVVARSHRSSSDQNGVYATYSTDGGSTWSSDVAISSFNDTAISNSPRRVVGVWCSPRTPGYAIAAAYTANGSPTAADLYVTTDWGATWSAASFVADPDEGLAYSVHVPWQNNDDESLVYYGSFNRDGNFVWGLRRTDGSTDSDISPANAGIDYGPIRSNFGIMSLDTDRLTMVMCGEADGSGTIDIDQSSTSAKGGAFVSSDGGDTWTMIVGPNTGGPNTKWPFAGAFASGDGDEIFLWGNEYVGHSTNGGSTVTDKSPQSPIATTQEVIGFVGGPLA